MKGYTKIQLFDDLTGKEVYKAEKHNEVTQAVQKAWDVVNMCDGKIYQSSSLYDSYSYPRLTEMMGGLLLFNQTIDSGSLYPKAGNMLLGCAGYGVQNTISSTMLGNYNSNESSIDYKSKTATFVYDFPTSTCNGEINSICLTNLATGFGKFYGLDVSSFNPDTFNYIKGYGMATDYCAMDFTAGKDVTILTDTENRICYTLQFERESTSTTDTTSTIVIKKYKYAQSAISLFINDGIKENNSRKNATVLLSEAEVKLDSMSFSFSKDSTQKVLFNYCTNGTTLFITDKVSNPELKQGMSITFAKLDMSLDSPAVEYVTVKCPDTEIIRFQTEGYWNYGTGKYENVSAEINPHFNFCADDNYIYAVVYRGAIVKMSYTNASDSKVFTSAIFSYTSFNSYRWVTEYEYLRMIQGRIFAYSYSHGNYVIDSSTGIAHKMDNTIYSYRTIPSLNDIVCGQYNIMVFGGWLATINNLEKTVKKTPANTMKITYTISES